MLPFARPVVALVVFGWMMGSTLSASTISGRIVVQKGVDREAAVAVTYDLRGSPVPDGAKRQESNFDRVAIWLERDGLESEGTAAAPVTATMQQHNRRLEPELLVVPVGSTVNFPNLDPIFHNIFSLSKAQSFDLGYYPKGSSRSVTFPHPGIVQVYCHVHPNMSGAIVVTSSRWFGKPDEDGRFSWTDLPPGKYRLMIWQRFTGLLRREVVAPRSGEASVRVAIPEEREER